jgi:hypothetical protein
MPGLFCFWSTTMSDEILKIVLDKVEKMETKISNAKSMNGGFDKLMMEVEHIKDTQTDILEGVRGVKQNLYEPDSGLFSRVKELESESRVRAAYVQETKPALDFAKELQVWKKKADKDLEDFEKMQIEFAKLQDWKAGAQKVIWLIATAAGGMWVDWVYNYSNCFFYSHSLLSHQAQRSGKKNKKTYRNPLDVGRLGRIMETNIH